MRDILESAGLMVLLWACVMLLVGVSLLVIKLVVGVL
jgi:hypothetical protein